jgi:hypothetical protein
MSTLNAIAQRPTLNPVVHGADQQNAAASAARQSLAGAVSARAAQVPAGAGATEAGDDSDSVTLSRQALNARVEQLGDQTIAAAQGFLQQFATSLFGDAAKGASFDFDSVSVAADTSLSAATVQASGPGDNGSTSVQAAALRFDESASFVGHGTLQTGDGQSYQFDIAVDYKASLSASSVAAQSVTGTGKDNAADTAADASNAPTPEQTLVGKQLPPVKYPGSLADLFKLLGRQLDVSAKDGDQDGQLSLRLIRLVNSAALLAPRPHADSADSSAQSGRAMAHALAQYAVPETAAPAPTAVTARGVAGVDSASSAPAAFSASA